MSDLNSTDEQIDTALSALVSLIAKLVAEDHVSAAKCTPASEREKTSEY